MKLGVKYSLTATIIIIITLIIVEGISLIIFTRAVHTINKKLFEEEADRLTLLAYEQNELFFEGIYEDEDTSKFRVIDKLRIDYRNNKKLATFPFIVDEAGKVILHPVYERGYQYFDKDTIRLIEGGLIDEAEHDDNGLRRWYVFKTYKPWKWIFCMTMPMKKKNAPIVYLVKMSFLITASGIMCSVIIILFMSGIYIRPLNRVIERMNKISKGQISSMEKVDVGKQSDEIGLLSATFNKMAEDLSKVTVSKDYVNSILASLTDMLFVLTPRGEITTVNRSVYDNLGYPPDELIGSHLKMILPDWDILFVRQDSQDARPFIKYDSLVNKETYLNTKVKTTVPVILSAAVIRNKEGDIMNIACTAHDITERKKKEEAIKRGNQELIESEKALKNIMYDMKRTNEELKNTQAQLVQSEKLASLGQLSAGIAHEINNPLGFITNNIVILEEYIDAYSEILRAMEGLKKTVLDQDWDKAVRMVQEIGELEEKVNLSYITGDIENLIRQTKNGADRIKKIIQDLKTFSRKDEGQMELNNIEDILEGVLSIVWNEIKYKAELKKEYGSLPLVICNSQKLGQVFINLMMNAAQAIKEKGEITIKTYIKDSWACIEIRDTGSGISQENIDKIFDPFFTTKEVGKGTGLGLSIGYDIIKQHKGEMQVFSEINKGTTFVIKLPV